MDYDLTLTKTLTRAVEQFGHKEIVTKLDDGSYHRYTFEDAYERICQLAHALDEYGLERGDRVSVMAVNHYRHYELYYGPSCSGRSIHMTNHRLPEEHLIEIINEAEDRLLFVDPAFVETIESVADDLETVEQYVVLDDSVPETSLSPVTDYESFIGGHPTEYDWPDLDEETECGICYTSGTTGLPKGAAYSHRGLYLLSMSYGAKDSFGVCEQDVILPVVPMFHVNGWCLPYSGTLYGSSFVLPGSHTDLESVEEMIRDEGVTLAAAVPTIWTEMATYIDENPAADISTLDRILTGGSSPPPAIMRRFEAEFDAPIIQGYGMTEASPHLVNTLVTTEVQELPEEEQYDLRTKPGQPTPGVELRLRDQNGDPVPHDGESTGEIQARSPWVIDEYFARPGATQESFTEDVPRSEAAGELEDSSSRRWFKTGDIGTIDEYGYLEVVDRLDDVIKSGGEWISSVELENELMAHEAVAEATVVSVDHERWQERPVAYVVTTDDVTEDDLRDHLLERFPKWWLPDLFLFADDIPRTSTGKYDKQSLRTTFHDEHGSLPTDEATLEGTPEQD
ncbi:long-chain fatty acid--CoA ligase [Natronolimnohabitans innermongolicus]|uniref:Acyl-CoA synthetase n=1 Tax=Natronolimnohabitans innermongolicus JCM 12255 TaxID=1227499 RepID=L9WM28_9EURY|nr:long-chain fatty acid--CoA ligase [Natronolimnohabitans innermongolicus]ELY50447.1 acyl-CoA synthetase [Natronolimnohabitans innermongolicus JCM 12255]